MSLVTDGFGVQLTTHVPTKVVPGADLSVLMIGLCTLWAGQGVRCSVFRLSPACTSLPSVTQHVSWRLGRLSTQFPKKFVNKVQDRLRSGLELTLRTVVALMMIGP